MAAPGNEPFTNVAPGTKVQRVCWTLAHCQVCKADHTSRILEWLNDPANHIQYYSFQLEVAPTTGYVHYQGYCESTNTKKRRTSNWITWIQSMVCRAHDNPRSCRIVKAVASREDNEEYTGKEESRASANDFGYPCGPWRKVVAATHQGRRSDLETIRDKIKDGATLLEIADQHADAFFAMHSAFKMYSDMVTNRERVEDLKERLSGMVLRPWQEHLSHILDADPDDRRIIWICDVDGNAGKSRYAQWRAYGPISDAQLFQPGKKENIAYQLEQDKRVFIYDVPRSTLGDEKDFVAYSLLEQVKNGIVESGKYVPRKVILPMCHVVILANHMPKVTEMSKDRWDIWTLKKEVRVGIEDFYLSPVHVDDVE